MADNLNQRINQREANQGGLNTVQTSTYGGLNTLSNRLNLPMEDSPDMLNVQVTKNGTIRKRRGSASLTTYDVENPSGYTTIPYTLRNGIKLLVVKIGTYLIVYEVGKASISIPNGTPFDDVNTIVQFNNVWHDNAANIRCDYTITSEQTPRIIMTTGINTVVQLSIVQSSTVTSGSGNTLLNFNDNRIPSGATSYVLYRNGVRYDNPSTMGANGAVTLSVTDNGSAVWDLVYFSWQWWTEGMRLSGKNILRETTQFQVSSPTDLSVVQPADLLIDIENLSSTRYPLQWYTSATLASGLLTFSNAPTTATEYAFTQGAVYTSGTTPTTGFTHITFGAFTAAVPTTPRRLIGFRHYSLPFQGGGGSIWNQVSVYDDNRSWTHNTLWITTGDLQNKQGTLSAPTFALASTSGSYGLGNRAINIPVYNTALRAGWIRFDSSVGNVLQSLDNVSIVSTAVTTLGGTRFIGSNASTVEPTPGGTILTVGGMYPVMGLYEICDFGRGSFPRNITLYAGRLVLASFPDAPLRVALSNVLDSLDVGKYYNSFQTTRITLNDASSFFIELGASSDDSITAVVEYQSSLFIFCRNALYRLSGTDVGSVTPTAFNVNFVAGIGALNCKCVVKVDKTIYFLSSSGVYDIMPTLDSADFTAGEKSLKVRTSLRQPDLALAEIWSWMVYDPVEQEVYVATPVPAISNKCCSQLMVYNILRDAWTILGADTRCYHPSVHGVVLYSGSSTRDILVMTPVAYSHLQSTGFRCSLRQLNYFLNIDGVFSDWFNTPFNLFYSFGAWIPYKSHTLTSTSLEYSTTTGNLGDFYMIPLMDVVDVKVTLGTQTLVHGVDWVKATPTSILLLKQFVPGQTLTITKTDANGKTPLAVYVDRVLKTEGIDYQINVVSAPSYGIEVQFFNNLPGNSCVAIGMVYDAWHYTPMSYADSLLDAKRFTKYIGYYKNNNSTWQSSIVNTGASQDPYSLVGSYQEVSDVNVSFVYEDSDTGYSTTDLYRQRDIFWDDSLFDISPQASQSKEYSRLVEPLLGTSYGLQVVNWNSSPGTFELVGYQVNATKAIKNSRGWNN